MTFNCLSDKTNVALLPSQARTQWVSFYLAICNIFLQQKFKKRQVLTTMSDNETRSAAFVTL